MTTNLVGNGVIGAGEYVTRSNQVVIIPFTLTKGSATTNGQIVAMLPGHPRSLFTVDVNLVPGQFNGGTMQVAGHVFAVQKNQINVVEVKAANVKLDFTGLHDDDDDTLLPRVPGLGVLEAAMKGAYILPLNDGGGNPANNQLDAPFLLNLPGDSRQNDEASFRRQAVGADDFWVVYILASYQHKWTSDHDPNFQTNLWEGGTGGVVWGRVTNLFVVAGGDGAQIFVETIRDRLAFGARAGLEERVLAHEVGHQMGLDHWDVGVAGVTAGPVQPNLMLYTVQSIENDQARFVPQHLHLLRSRIRTPGQ